MVGSGRLGRGEVHWWWDGSADGGGRAGGQVGCRAYGSGGGWMKSLACLV